MKNTIKHCEFIMDIQTDPYIIADYINDLNMKTSKEPNFGP